MDVKQKVCLITGGTSGIGAATAVALTAKGARVITVSRTGPHQGVGTLDAFDVRSLKGDVADAEACRQCVDQVIREFGRLDVLVHSAGGAIPGGLFSVSDEKWLEAFAVHVHSVFYMSRAVAPHMAAQGEGAIVLLGSSAGLRGCLGAIAYGVAKGALPQFARSLARELAEQHIRVNCIAPGIIRTPFQNILTEEQVANNIENRIPLHSEGKPEDVASIIVAILENDYITGETLSVDGGLTMRIV